MKLTFSPKIKSIIQLFEILPEKERIIVDVLRQIILENLPANCKEKTSYNVPFFYGKKGICIIWRLLFREEELKKVRCLVLVW